VHRALFRARHVQKRKILDERVVRAVLGENGIDVSAVYDEIATGATLQTIRKQHEAAIAEHNVWGVPTFIANDQAVFVRHMRGAEGDAAFARHTIERLIDQITAWPDLNEFKHTSLPK
jgi:predicted DsbA family dithiol-disulfide isomerase